MTSPDATPGSLAPMWRYVVGAVSIAALLWLLVARITGPSDLWDQTQPKTVSYTTDILAGGNWMLPIERGVQPATKPPLYNWIAAPFVALLGFASEFGHKFPSVIAASVCWLLVVRLGPLVNPMAGQVTGWLAGIMVVANYTIFKLGYLARPDMLLTMWMTLGWAAVTMVLTLDAHMMGTRRRRLLLLAFWVCVALAALTKGPPALVLLLYAGVAGLALTGSWRVVLSLGWWWGIVLVMAAVGLWLYGVWRVDPEHLRVELWHNEIYGRVTGTGSEGGGEGTSGWFTGLADMPLYFLVRFAPWSLCTVAGVFALWKREAGRRRWRQLPATSGWWLQGAALYTILVLVLFSLSAGKRADYLAPAFPAGALLAAWWLTSGRRPLALRIPWLVPACAVVVLSVLSIANSRQTVAPEPGFSDAIDRFIDEAARIIDAEPAPTVFCWTGESHLQAMLGHTQAHGRPALFAALDRGEPFWLIVGRRTRPPHEFDEWMATRRRKAAVEEHARSQMLQRAVGWPAQVVLYWVEPGE